jgi:hypothetical protein
VPFRTPAGFASGAPDMKLSVVLGFTALVIAISYHPDIV